MKKTIIFMIASFVVFLAAFAITFKHTLWATEETQQNAPAQAAATANDQKEQPLGLDVTDNGDLKEYVTGEAVPVESVKEEKAEQAEQDQQASQDQSQTSQPSDSNAPKNNTGNSTY